MAREKEEREAIQGRLDQLVSVFQNFGRPQQEAESQPAFDMSQPLTYADLANLQEQAQREEAEAKKTEYFSKMANETFAKDEYKDFKEVTKGHPFTKAVLSNKSFADSLEVLEKPFEFMYDAVKSHSKELEEISKINDSAKFIAELVRLETKVKQSAKVPNVTNAPNGVSDDHESSNAESTSNNIQDRRKRLRQEGY